MQLQRLQRTALAIYTSGPPSTANGAIIDIIVTASWGWIFPPGSIILSFLDTNEVCHLSEKAILPFAAWQQKTIKSVSPIPAPSFQGKCHLLSGCLSTVVKRQKQVSRWQKVATVYKHFSSSVKILLHGFSCNHQDNRLVGLTTRA